MNAFVVYVSKGRGSWLGDVWRNMSSINARLHLPGQTRLPLNVEVDIADERIVLRSGSRNVADWPLDEIEVDSRSDGFHVKFDNEEIVLNTDDPTRLALELGIRNGNTSQQPKTRLSGSARTLDPATFSELRYDDVKSRIAEIAEMLTSSSVAPSDVFARWLRLLKEINRRHGQGSLPTHRFYELNTELLDLIPEPKPVSSAADRG